MHEKNDDLDEYKKYEYYQKNYISQRENLELGKEDEHKLNHRENQSEVIKSSINNFFSSLDEEFQPVKNKVAVSLKAQLLEKIKRKRD